MIAPFFFVNLAIVFLRALMAHSFWLRHRWQPRHHRRNDLILLLVQQLLFVQALKGGFVHRVPVAQQGVNDGFFVSRGLRALG